MLLKMGLIGAVIRGLLEKLVFLAILGALVFFGWNWYKSKRESRTFTVSFNNIEGLSKGAPIYSNGVLVGKVIKTFPLGNTNSVGVKGLITDKDFPSPKAGVSAKIISNIESGGGKILEITNPIVEEHIGEELLARSEIIGKKGHNPYTMKQFTRLMRDFFQLSKDTAREMYITINSRQAHEYEAEFDNTIKNTVTSLEYGTLKQDVRNGIENLNREIEHFESSPNKRAQTKRAIDNKVQALRNTIESFGSLADVYKD